MCGGGGGGVIGGRDRGGGGVERGSHALPKPLVAQGMLSRLLDASVARGNSSLKELKLAPVC